MKSKYDHQTKSIYSCFKQFLGLKQGRMNLNSENTDNIMLFIFGSGNPLGNPLVGTIRLTHKRL